MAVEKGDEAPDFELPDQDGERVRLSGLRGRPVVLYFYAKADTPGCTTQACGVRDHMPSGCSPDEDHSVAERYGVWVEKSSRVADVIPKVSPKTHDEQVLKILGSM